MAELAAGFHDALVPRHRCLQHVEAHGDLGGCFAPFDRFSPRDQRFGRVTRRTLTRQDAHHQIALTVTVSTMKHSLIALFIWMVNKDRSWNVFFFFHFFIFFYQKKKYFFLNYKFLFFFFYYFFF